MMMASNWFVISAEKGCYYRPNYLWSWASEQPMTQCTLGKPTLDCYFQPLSKCNIEHINGNLTTLEIPKPMDFKPKTIDSCGLAKWAKKSLQWVHGNILHYMMRPNIASHKVISERLNMVYQHIKEGSNSSLIGVHIRGGTLEHFRHPANLSYYIDAVDKIAAELSAIGKPVGAVFICSNTPDKTFVSMEHLTLNYPRPWKYVTLPHASSPADALLELGRFDAAKSTKAQKTPKEILALEFFSDIEILVRSDAFIGSWSNIYFVTTALRVARGTIYGHNRYYINNSSSSTFTYFKNHSCFMNIKRVPPVLECEGSPESRLAWYDESSGGYHGSSPSFEIDTLKY